MNHLLRIRVIQTIDNRLSILYQIICLKTPPCQWNKCSSCLPIPFCGRPSTLLQVSRGWRRDDAVYDVRSSLIVDPLRHDLLDQAAEHGVAGPFYMLNYDFLVC